jgi:hypothetical protein
METKQQNVILTYGLLGGLISILAFVLLYFAGAQAFVNPLAFGLAIIPITMMVLACRAKKKQNEGYLTFAEGLKTAFGVSVVMSLCSRLVNYVVFNFVDVAFRERLTQLTMEKAEAMMKKFGVAQDQIDKAIQKMATENQFSLGKTIQGFAFECIFWFIVALIVAAIVKKKKPEFPGVAS